MAAGTMMFLPFMSWAAVSAYRHRLCGIESWNIDRFTANHHRHRQQRVVAEKEQWSSPDPPAPQRTR